MILPPRRFGILKKLAEGKSDKEIACDLDISRENVSGQRLILMRKLDIRDKAEFVQWWSIHGADVLVHGAKPRPKRRPKASSIEQSPAGPRPGETLVQYEERITRARAAFLARTRPVADAGSGGSYAGH
jgi:DNA-binding CsgD family transcriptional regulator